VANKNKVLRQLLLLSLYLKLSLNQSPDLGKSTKRYSISNINKNVRSFPSYEVIRVALISFSSVRHQLTIEDHKCRANALLECLFTPQLGIKKSNPSLALGPIRQRWPSFPKALCSQTPVFTLWDHGYEASASCGVPFYVPAFACTHSNYPQRDGQAELTWVAGCIAEWSPIQVLTGPGVD